MKFLLFLFSLVAFQKWVLSDVQLISSGPSTVRPEQNIHLLCKVTGVSITDSSYLWNWIRQSSGKGLEWVARIYPYDGRKWYSASLQSRVTISSDNSKNEFSLQLNSLTAADSAVYFCAREKEYYSSYYGLDYWGPGTSVTVSSVSPVAPTVFPLIPSSESITNGANITIGCLVKGFRPDPVTFSWSNANSGIIKITKFPSISSNGAFTVSSQAVISACVWKNFDPFYCTAGHYATNRTVRVVRQALNLAAPPNIIISAPSLTDFVGSPLNATITCNAINLHTQETTLQWLRDETVLEFDGPTTISTSNGSYSLRSELTVTKSDWDNGKKFSCNVFNEKFNGIRNISKPLICGNLPVPDKVETIPVKVETIQPSFADIFQTKTAILTCRISNIPDDQDLEELDVTWIRADDGKPLETTLKPSQEQESSGLLFKDAVATVCADEWNKGETFQCKIIHPALFPSMEVRSLRKPQDGNPSAPHIYILPPPSDQLALKETATVTCLLKGFSPSEFFVKWLRNGEPVDATEYFTNAATQESTAPKRYYAYSMLKVNAEEWNSGTTYTCVVGHEMLPLQTSQKTIDKNTGKPTIVNVSLVLSDIASTCQ